MQRDREGTKRLIHRKEEEKERDRDIKIKDGKRVREGK
jgi:hypothetical protein